MKYAPLSQRQMIAMLWWEMPAYKEKEAIICDGSIRSGKTVAMTVGFVMWAMAAFHDEKFAICGKTVESCRRNIIVNLRDWLPGEYAVTEKRTENLVEIEYEGKRNSFYIFGGRDEASYMLVQGITLAGCLLDEVALMPRSFVDQVFARCSVPGSKIWLNCNPASPSHWVYKEWVCKAKKKKALRLHFTMTDNSSLSPAIKERYESLYTGVFYQRYIAGKWVLADGLVYSFFDRTKHVIKNPEEKNAVEWYISVDYGTFNATSMGLWMIDEQGRGIRVKEYYHSGRETKQELTSEEYYAELEKLAGDRKIEAVIVDPAASEFIVTIRRHGKYSVRKAKNAVLPGISLTATAMKSGFLLIGASCKDCIRELGLYTWDEKKNQDAVVKKDDHSMDEMRYFVMTVLKRRSAQFRQFLREAGYKEEASKDD